MSRVSISNRNTTLVFCWSGREHFIIGQTYTSQIYFREGKENGTKSLLSYSVKCDFRESKVVTFCLPTYRYKMCVLEFSGWESIRRKRRLTRGHRFRCPRFWNQWSELKRLNPYLSLRLEFRLVGWVSWNDVSRRWVLVWFLPT